MHVKYWDIASQTFHIAGDAQSWGADGRAVCVLCVFVRCVYFYLCEVRVTKLETSCSLFAYPTGTESSQASLADHMCSYVLIGTGDGARRVKPQIYGNMAWHMACGSRRLL